MNYVFYVYEDDRWETLIVEGEKDEEDALGVACKEAGNSGFSKTAHIVYLGIEA